MRSAERHNPWAEPRCRSTVAILMNFTSFLIHFVGAALSCAQLAYWSIRLTTPPPTAAPAPARSESVRDPDPVLLARAFGQIDRVAAAAISNIQVAGVFAAGRDSAAVFVVDDRPARAVLLGQEVAPGSTLVEVNPQSVTLQTGPTRRELRVPNPPLASLSGAGPGHGAAFARRGNVLSAPSVEATTTGRPGSARPLMPGGPGRLEPPPGPTRGAGPPTAQ
jgi:general secretion pathway protein C